jgi:hypothetical protein
MERGRGGSDGRTSRDVHRAKAVDEQQHWLKANALFRKRVLYTDSAQRFPRRANILV